MRSIYQLAELAPPTLYTPVTFSMDPNRIRFGGQPRRAANGTQSGRVGRANTAMADSFEQTTIRGTLLSVVVDHLMKGKITCSHTHQVGCELVALLSAYR